MAGPAVLSIKILADAKKASKGFADAGKSLDFFNGKLGKVGPLISTGLSVAMVAAPAAALAVGKALYDIGSEFDEMSDTIRVGTGASGEALNSLMEDAKSIANNIPASFDQIGKTVADVNTRLGLSGDSLQTVASQILEVNRMLGTEVNLNQTTGALEAFNVAGEKTSSSLDTLFRVSQSTGIEFNSLSDSLGKNAGTLQSLGFDFNRSAALIGTLDKAGVDVNKTLGSMSSALVKLAKNGEDPQQAFARVTNEIDAMIKTGDKAGAIDLSGKIFGTKGASNFIQAIEKGSFKLEELDAIARGSGDTILSLGAETMDASERMQILGNRVKTMLAPLASTVFDGAAKALEWLLDILDGWNTDNITDFFKNPYVTYFTKRLKTLGASTKNLWTALVPVAEKIASYFNPAVKSIWETVQAVLPYVKDAFWAVFTVIENVINLITSLFKGDWQGAWEASGKIVQNTWKLITSIISGSWELVKGIFATGTNYIKGLWSLAWDAVCAYVNTAWNGVKTAVSAGINAVVEYVKTLPSKVLTALGGVGTYLYQSGKDLINGFIKGIKDMGSALWNSVTNLASNAVKGVKKTLGINSPSRVAMEMGGFFSEGLALGIRKKTGLVEKATQSVSEVFKNTDITAPGFTNANHSAPASERGRTINITVNGALDPRATARQIKDLLLDLERSNGVVLL